MDAIHEELDEDKAEIDRLRVEYKIKSELSDNLKRAHNEQLVKFHEANMKLDKQDRELNEKTEELSMAKQQYEDLKCNFSEKESIIKRLAAANDKLRVDTDEKCRKWEEENRRLASAIDEQNEKCMEQEQKIFAYKEEIEGLKKSLAVSQKRCLESEGKSKATKQPTERDDLLIKIEEENGRIKDQLKWKKEQFKHLEEALEKVRNEFKMNKKEWEMDKSTLLDKINSLQTSLDSQARVSKDLQNKLEMCNQALAYEESRRKKLQVQVSEFQERFENAFSECNDAKLQFEDFTAQRVREIAALRHSLSTKETFNKEREYQTEKLKQENQELKAALKELREAQIREAGSSSSLAKLRNKLKTLETLHKEDTSNFGAREAKWSSQLEKMTQDLNNSKSELGVKEALIEELKEELKYYHASTMQLKLQNEELSIMLLVMKLGISEAQLKLVNKKAEIDLNKQEKKEKVSQLRKQLEVQNAALVRVQMDFEEEHCKVVSLKKKVESLSDLIKEQSHLNQNEVDRYKEMVQESSRDQLHLKEQILQMERNARVKFREVSDALDRAKAELAEKICEFNEVEFELQIWKSIAERLKVAFEENHQMRKVLEASLLAQVDDGETVKLEKDGLIQTLEDRERKIDCLEKQINLLDQELKIRDLEPVISEKIGTATSVKSENESVAQTMREKDETIEQESFRREFEAAVLAQLDAEKTFEYEKQKMMQLVEEKNTRINYLTKLVESLEQKFNGSLISFSSQLAEKQAEIHLFHEAWEKIAAAMVLSVVEIELKKLMIVELEDDMRVMQQKQERQENSSTRSEEQALNDAKLAAKELELKKLTKFSDALVNELKSVRSNLLEDVTKLSSEREILLDYVSGIGNQINEFSSADKELMDSLAKTMLSFDNNVQGMNVKREDENLCCIIKENVGTPPTALKKLEIPPSRSPFRELNG